MSCIDEHRAAERVGHEIGRQMVERVSATSDTTAQASAITAAVVLCATDPHPREAFAGFADAIVPAFSAVPVETAEAGHLAARATLAGHTCTTDAAGQVTLSRWGRAVTFQDVGAASAWLDRVTGKVSHGY